MLYFVFTVDGDWEEYYDPKLPDEVRKPDKEKLEGLIDREISFCRSAINGKFIHFIHTSPRARDFFLGPEFISKWKEIEAGGGNIGVHCHEEDPRRAYFFGDPEKMRKAVVLLSEGLKSSGLDPVAFRGGYMAFAPSTIPILEENKIFLDFSCEPGRYLIHEGDLLVSDWRGAPENIYRMDRADHRRPGRSGVFEVPVGRGSGGSLYFEKTSLINILRTGLSLKKKARDKDIIVSVLAHTFDFGKKTMLIKMKLGLIFMKMCGKFISGAEALLLAKR